MIMMMMRRSMVMVMMMMRIKTWYHSIRFHKTFTFILLSVCLLIWLCYFSVPETSDNELVIAWNRTQDNISLSRLLKFYSLKLGANGQLTSSILQGSSMEEIQSLELSHKHKKHCTVWKNRKSRYSFPCVKYKVLRTEIPLCVYSRKEDFYISSAIHQTKTWEPDSVAEIGKLLLLEPDAHFIDIGANIGAFTIYMAALGRKVVAIEPLGSNMERLWRSLELSNLLENVTLVHNAVSDKRGEAMLEIPKGNIGGAYLRSNYTQQEDTVSVKVKTILLNDVLEVTDFSTVILKIDAEGHELNILEGATEFFQVLNVKYILMEWLQHRYRREGVRIINSLLHKGFLPSSNATRRTVLDPDTYYSWPSNIYWMKR